MLKGGNFIKNFFMRKKSLEIIKDEIDRIEIIKNILQTKHDLDAIRQNYEFAESDMVDYYSYQIKANQSKLNFLIKAAKEKNLELNAIDKMKFDNIV